MEKMQWCLFFIIIKNFVLIIIYLSVATTNFFQYQKICVE